MPSLNDLLAELTSGDDSRAESAIPGLTAMGEDSIPALLDLTHSPDSDHRWWAVRALANSPHTRTENLVPLLSDSAPEVRAATALALCSHPHESAVPALIKTLADEDSLTAGLAGNALAAIGVPSVLALLEVMKEAGVGVRIIALRALSEIKDHRAIKTMMDSMSDDSAIVQYWAKEGLDRLGLNMVYIKP
ncbi:MAG: HEAT repeat domain-containing protein [Chloroflexi bacterium]|nr:HEAT repeat domain-containing protein [Chloroflexota bacterium]